MKTKRAPQGQKEKISWALKVLLLKIVQPKTIQLYCAVFSSLQLIQSHIKGFSGKHNKLK